jgi:hypothetical protein
VIPGVTVSTTGEVEIDYTKVPSTILPLATTVTSSVSTTVKSTVVVPAPTSSTQKTYTTKVSINDALSGSYSITPPITGVTLTPDGTLTIDYTKVDITTATEITFQAKVPEAVAEDYTVEPPPPGTQQADIQNAIDGTYSIEPPINGVTVSENGTISVDYTKVPSSSLPLDINVVANVSTPTNGTDVVVPDPPAGSGIFTQQLQLDPALLANGFTIQPPVPGVTVSDTGLVTVDYSIVPKSSLPLNLNVSANVADLTVVLPATRTGTFEKQMVLSDAAGITWSISPALKGVSISSTGLVKVDYSQLPMDQLPIKIYVAAVDEAGSSLSVPIQINCACGCGGLAVPSSRDISGGGGSIDITGPCFTTKDVVTMQFGSLETTCTILDETKARCLTPRASQNMTEEALVVVNGNQLSLGQISLTPPTISISPMSGSILGGATVSVFGLVFESSASVVARFGSTVVTCTRLTAEQASCPAPILYSLGALRFDISVDGGKTYPYPPSTFESLSLSEAPGAVARAAAADGWKYDVTHAVTWDPILFSATTKLNVSLWAYDTPSLPGKWKMVKTLGSLIMNSGQYSLVIPGTVLVDAGASITTIGEFHIRVSSPTASIVSDLFTVVPVGQSKELCLNWAEADAASAISADPLPTCPCTLNQAKRDQLLFELEPGCETSAAPLDTPYDYCRSLVFTEGSCPLTRAGMSCLQSRDPTTGGVGLECCYYRSTGGLVPASDLGAGTVVKVHPDAVGTDIVPEYTNFLTDVAPYEQCCVFSDNCATFKAQRVSTTCTGYSLPWIASGRADGVVRTFDGLSYKLFDTSDRLLMRVNDEANFQVQLRSQSNFNFATGQTSVSFSAIAAATSTSTVMVFQATAAGAIEVIADGNPVSFESTLNLDFTGVSVSLDCGTGRVTAIFNEVNTQILLDASAGSLAFSVMIPDAMNGKTVGLLGTFNENIEDDFTLPDGTTVSVEIEERLIFYSFEATWRVYASSSLFENSIIAPSSFVPDFEGSSLSQCDPAIQDQILAICNEVQSCIDAAAPSCSVSLAQTIADQIAGDQEDVLARNMPPVITPATIDISLKQIGEDQLFIRDLSAVDPQDSPLTWTFETIVDGVTITPAPGATSAQLSFVINSQLVSTLATIKVIVTNEFGASAVSVVSLVCTCGCPFGGFTPSINTAPLDTAIPVTVPVCVESTDSMVCRFTQNALVFDSAAVYAVEGGAGVGRCLTPLMGLGGQFELTFSANGGRSFPYNGGMFTFSPNDVSILSGVVGLDGVTYPSVEVNNDALCDLSYCTSDPYRPSDFQYPYDHGICVETGSAQACATAMSSYPTTYSEADLAATTWDEVAPVLEQQLYDTISPSLAAVLSTGNRRAVAATPALKVIVLNYDIVDSFVRVFFFVLADGTTLPPVVVSNAIAGTCITNKNPKLYSVCGQGATTGASSSGSAASSNLYFLLLLLVVLVAVVVVAVIVTRNKRKPSTRGSATDDEIGRAVSFANPMYGKNQNANQQRHDDMYVDDHELAAFEPASTANKSIGQQQAVSNPMYDNTPATQANTYESIKPVPGRAVVNFSRGVTSVSTDVDTASNSNAPAATMADSYLDMNDQTTTAPAQSAQSAPMADSYLDMTDETTTQPAAPAQAGPVADSYLEAEPSEPYGFEQKEQDTAGGYLQVGPDAE